jgi:predicted N-acetyltransferase YhbS
MKIRTAIESDKHALEEFLVFNNGERNRKLANEYITCMFSNDYRKPTFVVAEIDGNIIGAAAFSEELFTVGTWGISWVSVHQEHRSQGIGQKLVEACLGGIQVKVSKNVTVILGTYPDKTELYERLGFVEMRKDHDGGSFMMKTLRSD